MIKLFRSKETGQDRSLLPTLAGLKPDATKSIIYTSHGLYVVRPFPCQRVYLSQSSAPFAHAYASPTASTAMKTNISMKIIVDMDSSVRSTAQGKR